MLARHLLVGLDLAPDGGGLAPGARRAVDRALWLAEPLEARVTLLHSSAGDEAWSASRGGYVWVPDGLEPEARRTLDGVAEEFRNRGIPSQLEVVEEKAWLAITHRVQTERIDLVVVGKRNEAEAAEHRMGSVSMELLRNCPSAVWVVKPGEAPGLHRLLAATDLSPVGERVIAWAGWLAERCKAELHVVHALQLPLAVQVEGPKASREYEKHAAASAVERIRAGLAERDLRVPPVFRVGFDAPTRAILDGARALDPDLVVLGTVSRRGIAGVVLGNTAERLLDRLDRSLLTVKPEDFESSVPPATLESAS